MCEKRNVEESLKSRRNMFQYRLTFEYHLLSLHASFKSWKGLLLCNTNDSKPLKMGQKSFLMTVSNFFVGYEKGIFFVLKWRFKSSVFTLISRLTQS